MEAIYHSEGRAFPLGSGNYEYQYTIKDHLGNSRVIYKVVTGTATILQENHYYAFGMELEHTGFVGSTNMYRYNGKEMINDFGLDSYDYGARYYGATIGRWGQMDPLAEEYQGLSPTIYTGNNPIRYIDPNGMYFTNGSQKYLTRLNKYMGVHFKMSRLHGFKLHYSVLEKVNSKNYCILKHVNS